MKSVFLDAAVKLLVVLLLATSPIASFAQSFYWGDAPGYPTPLAYCEANKGIHTNVYVTFQSPTLALCWGRHSSGAVLNFGQVGRSGDSCPPDSQYDEATGSCKLPSPDAGKTCEGTGRDLMPRVINTAGDCVDYSAADDSARCKFLASGGTQFMTFIISFDQDGAPLTPPSPEKFGCKVDVISVAQCKLPPPSCSKGICLPKQIATCKVAASFTGETAGNGGMPSVADPGSSTEGVCPDPATCNVPDIPSTEENKQCNYVLDGEGRKVCDSRQFQGDPGSKNCGTINGGAYGCTDKVPSGNGTDVSTTVDTKPNPDGGTTSTKTDVATQYNCNGKYTDCKVTTTTTTTTTHKNADGSVSGTNTSTTCSGAQCGGSGTGTSGGGGGNKGKGDDTTNCDPATDPKACEGGSTDGGGKKCDAPIQCDGDAVMCAILQQQHKDTCELMAEPTDEQKAKFEQSKVAEQAKVDSLQDDLDQKVGGLFADFKSKATGGNYPGQCLEDKQVDIMGTAFVFPFSKACPYLYLLRYAIIAMAYLAAARIVSRGL